MAAPVESLPDIDEDDCTKSLQEMVDDFRFCHKMSPLEIATMLKEMRIDIAVDLAG